MLKLIGGLVIAIFVVREVLTFSVNVGWIGADFKSILEACLIVMSLAVGAIKYVLTASERILHSKKQINHRTELIESVRLNWISGVLDETLKDATFKIPAEPCPEQAGNTRVRRISSAASTRANRFALGPLLNAKLRVFKQRADLMTPEAIKSIYHGALENLLILGAPGSGKTVLLLELARSLLKEAERDETKGVPVVLNLSSWGARARRIDEWLISELKRHYGASNRLAKQWIKSDSLIYLFDGLDEVAEDLREDCLDAINAFISVPRQLVICSRLAEYEVLSKKANAHDAIELQPLSKYQVERVFSKYLPRETAKAMVDCITANEAVWHELNRPLFINILISTYGRGNLFTPLTFDEPSKQQIQTLVIEPFLMSRLRNNPNKAFSNENAWRYLAWIAHNLKRNNAQQFYIEAIQGDWLPVPNANRRMRFTPLSCVRRLNVDLRWTLESVSIAQDGVPSVFTRLLKSLLPGQTLAVLGLTALAVTVLTGQKSDLALVMMLVIYVFSVAGSIVTTLWPFDARLIESRNSFNQGASDALRVGLMRSFKTGILLGLSTSLFFPLYLATSSCQCLDVSRLIPILPSLFARTFVVGCAIGVLLGTLREVAIGSWANLAKHVLVRTALWRNGLAPRRFDRFLHMVVERRIMRRVGGSVLFVHRYLLEYFADQWEQ